MSFLAPIFLGGLLLIAVPWLVHRIRRPERETVRFSSLMFVPDVKHEVIERRRLQHVLLMLLRMALLVLLALAFARPFREVILGADTPVGGATYHAIVLDASLSMDGYWDAAKDGARDILDDMAPGDRVAVVRFARTAMIDAALTDDVAFARQAIDAAETTWEKGDFLVGLQAAEEVLGSAPDVRRVVHLISDFQATGLPESETGWRLPADIVFEPVVMGAPMEANASVEAVAVRPMREGWQVRARVKNWSGPSALTARVTVADRVVDTRLIAVPAGNASQVRFDVPLADGPFWGAVEVVQTDGMVADNRRFFAWQPAPKPHVLALRSSSGRMNRLLEAALPDEAGLPLSFTDARTFVRDLDAGPDVVIAGGLDDLSAAAQNALAGYVRTGGKLFLPLQESAGAEALNRLLAEAGVRVDGPAFPRANPSAFSEWAWVDLDHPVFQPFRGPQFNDFSTVHTYNFHRLTLSDGPTVLARFDDNAPAMVEAVLGTGRVLIWTGGLDLARTNLARTPRFVPLLHETLRDLIGVSEERTTFAVGDVVAGSIARVAPDARTIAGRMDVPGVYRRERSGESLWLAVQVDAAESDPARITPAEFEIRLCDAPVLVRNGERIAVDARVERWEYGVWALALLMGLLVMEHFYAAHLARQEHTA